MRHIKILKELLNLNRHHISPDMDLALKKLFRVYGGKIDQYTNDPKLTWRIPPGYKVIKAELRNDKGKLICSHKLNPMHLWSYSPSFKGTVSFSVLKKKILVDLNRPDSILFHFRNQYRFTKPNWGFSLNAKQYAMLNKNEKYHVNIQTKFYDAPLKQYISNEPSKKNNLILVAHLDHYCQLNDGLSSAIVNNEVAYELRKKLKNINLCSLNSIEIVGSVYFLNKYKLNSSNTIAAISTNGLSLEGNFKFQLSGKQEAILNKLLKIYSLIYMSKSSIEQFREGWGNDEIAFEVPGINIACGSVHRGPHPTYHSHLDNFSKFSNASFSESKNLLKSIILNLDKNYNIKIKNWRGLICLANPNIDMYVEPFKISNINQKSDLKKLSFYKNLLPIELSYLKDNKKKVINFSNKFQSYLANNNDVNIIDVAYAFSLPVNYVLGYFKKLEDRGFVDLKYIDTY